MKSKSFILMLATTCGIISHATADLTYRWALNETSLDGGILESVSGSTTAVLLGDATGVVANPGSVSRDLAYLFKGNAANNGGNAVNTVLTDVLPATGDFSVFVTARFASNYQGGARMLFSNNNNNGLIGRTDFGINGSAAIPNRLTFFISDSPTNITMVFTDSTATPILFDGGWHQVGITRSGSTFQLYIDGVAVGTSATSSVAINTATLFRIGRRTEFTGFFNNAISEVQVFDDARTQGQPVLLVALTPYQEWATENDIDPFGPKGGPNDDFDDDGSLNLQEFEALNSVTINRDVNGVITGTTTFAGSSDPTEPDSQPDSDEDNLPDGWENLHFGNLNQGPTGDFDIDTFNNAAEFAAASNPARVRSTPDNVNDTVQVAIATSIGIDEYSVQNNTWTFVRQITAGETTSLLFHDGSIFAASSSGAIRRVNPATGTAVTLVTRNEGDALTAGWTTANARGMEIGPDGKLYFATAFTTPQGEGVFRMNLDGTSFEEFIPRIGNDYELSNALDLAWKDANTVFVTSRGAFDATNRFVYQFDASGNYVATLANSLQGPQGLLVDGDKLWVTGTNAATALVALDLTATAPLTPQVIRTGNITNHDVVEILGELHVVAFPGTIRKDVFKPAMQTVLASVGTGVNANDMVVFESAANPYDIWATGFGIDPNAPNGGPTADFEGDGTTNGVEFALGLNPTSGTSRFAITTTGSATTGLTLTWPSAEGIEFKVRSSFDLLDWTTIEATVTGQVAETTSNWTAPAATPGASKFYRVEFTP